MCSHISPPSIPGGANLTALNILPNSILIKEDQTLILSLCYGPFLLLEESLSKSPPLLENNERVIKDSEEPAWPLEYSAQAGSKAISPSAEKKKFCRENYMYISASLPPPPRPPPRPAALCF